MPHMRSGFTLVEMAVVLVIIGLVMLTLFPALNAVRSANQRALTQSNLHSLMLATAAYVQANGCLPCPTNAMIGNTLNGSASFGKVGTTNNVACGTCPATAVEGIPPFVSLGIPSSTAHDGWGHWITMRVDPALTQLPVNAANCGTTNTCSVFAPPTAPCTATDVTNGFCLSTQLGFSDKGLCKTGLSTANRILVTTPGAATQPAAVIFVSHGTTGYGAYFAQAAPSSLNGPIPFPSGDYAPCSNSGGFAVCNASHTVNFMDAPTVTADFDPYDDILAYADRNSLVSMLGNSGCQTVW